MHQAGPRKRVIRPAVITGATVPSTVFCAVVAAVARTPVRRYRMSPVTWIGTCRNPADGRNYVISYNDCCGKSSCGACLCQRDEATKPLYRPDKTNDINWCLGTTSLTYHCSTAIVVGVAFEAEWARPDTALPCWAGPRGAGDINSQRAQFNYQMSCQGCHAPDGSGAGEVP